ncbi:hypothetical protein EJO66_22380 [Variovorax beijingensis]|uniref:Uncharacterized protein n=1 Tax=Variovorax beijingensis TaxID=2496117 RepID=A0ABY0A1K6_9BURK|nr:hypothetical protein [Variovorax beijingensis]RSZ32000.1 hypothetical protein EJO66_22380 [Variovorax beijingensis]
MSPAKGLAKESMASDSKICSDTGCVTADAVCDLFKQVVRPEAQLNPRFCVLRDRAEFEPARGLVSALHRTEIRDKRPDYFEYFRRKDFDSALFELFLVALFKAAGHGVDLKHDAPALLLTKGNATAAVDAFTVGTPVIGVEPQVTSPRSVASEPQLHGLGGILFQRLHRRAWRVPHADGHPFVLALQDFDHGQAHGAPSALLHFLFGSGPSQELGELFPDGFFGHQEAEHVSGVLFCNDATIAKFNRLGQEEHAASAARMLRHGACLAENGDTSTAAGYAYEVGQRGAQREQWNEGTVLIHNPFALHPLPPDWLGASAEVRCKDGQTTECLAHGFHPFSSTTELLRQDAPAWWVEERKRLLEQEQAAHPSA